MAWTEVFQESFDGTGNNTWTFDDPLEKWDLVMFVGRAYEAGTTFNGSGMTVAGGSFSWAQNEYSLNATVGNTFLWGHRVSQGGETAVTLTDGGDLGAWAGLMVVLRQSMSHGAVTYAGDDTSLSSTSEPMTDTFAADVTEYAGIAYVYGSNGTLPWSVTSEDAVPLDPGYEFDEDSPGGILLANMFAFHGNGAPAGAVELCTASIPGGTNAALWLRVNWEPDADHAPRTAFGAMPQLATRKVAVGSLPYMITSEMRRRTRGE
jgi:hypothetical protein